jgi:hypothetical protein
MAKKLTDADLMTGFNPAYGVSAEEIEAQGDAEGSVEGAEAAEPTTDTSGDDAEGASLAPPEGGADMVEVRLDGRALKAPKDIAEAFTREINRRDGTRGAEMQQLRERLAHLEGRVTATPAGDKEPETPEPQLPDPDLAIENKDEYNRQLDSYIAHQQEKRLSALARQQDEATAAQRAEAERVSAWNAHCDAFYSRPENKVLVGNEDIVDAVLEKNRAKLATLPVEDGFAELGRLAKERLARVTGQAPEVKARTTPKPPNLEGSSRRSAAVRPAAKDEGPQSLTQALKDRRRAAASAFNKGGSRAA